MDNKNVKQKIAVALLSCIFFVLSIYGTINIHQGFRISFQSLPIYIASVMFGTYEAAIVGLIGMSLNQIIIYGIEPFTCFFVLPYVILGIVFSYLYKHFVKSIDNNIEMIIALVLSNALLTILNIVVLYFHSKLYGYYNYVMIVGATFIKLVSSVLTAIIYFLILKMIIKTLYKIYK